MRRTTLAALVTAGLLIAGCGDGDDDPRADPGGTPTGSVSSEPTEPTEPVMEPATGFLIDLDRIRMHAPEGWKKNDPLSTFLLQADDPSTFSSVALGDLSAVGDPSLQQQARFAIDNRRGAQILDPVEIAGAQWYHVAGPQDRYVTFEQFGTVHNGSQATIDFLLDKEIPEDEQEELIGSVLASVEWK